MKTELLQELGLTENETETYLCLIKEGECTANQVSEKTGLHRGYVYDTLSKMINKGVVSYIVKSGIKKFRGVNPNKFKEIIKEKEAKINELIPELLKVYNTEKSDYNVEILEGIEGIKTYYERFFDLIIENPENEIYILGLKIGMEEHLLKYYQANLHKRAKKKGLVKDLKSLKLKNKLLFDRKAKKEKRISKEYLNYRYLPKGFDAGKQDLKIIGDKIAIESYEGKPFVLIITNKGISLLLKQMFNLIWNISSKN